MPTAYDSPWKEALEVYFQPFMAFFFPAAGNEIDWSRGYEPLDKELQQIAPRSATGTRTVDKLMKVWRQDGEEEWVLVHVEVQSQEDPEFLVRMYAYNYRTFDRYNQKVVSLAVLGDDRPGWRPDRFGYSLWGCRIDFQFPVVKLLDCADRIEELERDRNPFSAVVLAHLKALETQGDAESRRAWKVRLVKGLYDRGFDRENIRQLFRLIDWMMMLPNELEQQFCLEIERFEEKRKMPYITSVERLGIEKGVEKGKLDTLLLLLEKKFGKLSPAVRRKVRRIESTDKLDQLLLAVLDAESLEDMPF